MTVKEIRESGILEHHVLGLLSEQDVLRVEGYLMQFPELQKDYLEIQMAMQSYAKSEGITPKRNLEAQIKSLIKDQGNQNIVKSKKENTTSANKQNDNTKKPNNNSSNLFKNFILFSLGAITMLSSWYAYEKNNDNKKLQQSYIALKDDCENERASQDEIILKYKEINRENSKTLNFTPTKGYNETNLLFHFNPVTQKNYIQIKKLPAIASNQAFQLWSLKDGTDPIPLTVFKNGEDFIIPVDFEQGTGTYAITIENENGATTPTLSRLIGTVGVT